jgi:hypothetical protein
MNLNESLCSEGDLARRLEARRAREAAKYAPARCRLCKRLFVPVPRAPHQKYCCDEHRKEHFRRRKVLPLKTLITQGRRQESAPRRCSDCGDPLPPPGKTGVLKRACDRCRVRRCRRKKKGTRHEREVTMTLEELDAIRARYNPDADWTRTKQESEDVRALIAALECEAAAAVRLHDFVERVADCPRPLPAGLQEEAWALLFAESREQGAA